MYTAIILLSTLLFISALKPIRGGNFNNFTPQETLPLRGILAILIICTHFGPFFKTEWPVIDTWDWFGGPVVACFFFLSGYGLSFSFRTKGEPYIISFFRKRFNKLLPAFILMTIAAIVYKSLSSGTNIYEQISKMAVGVTPLATSWFVYALIIFYLAFYIFARLTQSLKRTGIYLILFTLAYIFTFRIIGFGGYWVSSIPSFIIGFYASIYQNQIKEFITSHRIAFYLIVFIALVLSAIAANYQRNLFQILITTLVAVSVYFIMLRFKLPQNPVINFLGKISYEIYLMQGFMFGMTWTEHPLRSFLIIFSASIVGGYLLHILTSSVPRLAKSVLK